MFPKQRKRRLRNSNSIRKIVSENHLTVDDLVTPIFLTEGKKIKEEIESMPGYFRLSLDLLQEEIDSLWGLGLKAVLLFAKIPNKLKDNKGTEALNENGLMQKGIKLIKSFNPEILVISDVALDPYSSYGHDGIVLDNKILNDETNKVLSKVALSHAQAGVDFVSPSDMMDGRIGEIRRILENNGFKNTGIMSYSVKYASNLYSPFRDALSSNPGFGDKKTYQMDFHNRKEAISETLLDIDEGADIVIVKPGIFYLDIISDLNAKINQPIAAYQVSGEYAMLKAAQSKGWIDYHSVIYENMVAFKRAGCSMIITYCAKDIASILNTRKN
ncbi:MAG: porphobilinogen synthase [Flavobacteriaceae bacterium]|tara:strand:- start:5694 stop:6680 length:987 start_codon:yes stop_codon:yes gene_type:complete